MEASASIEGEPAQVRSGPGQPSAARPTHADRPAPGAQHARHADRPAPGAQHAHADRPTQADQPPTARPVDDLDPRDPLTIKSYRLLGRIGGIHLSDVFLAQQPLTNALCVVKVAGATQFNETERFQREAQYLGRIHSLRVAKMLESGLWQGRPYLVQEFVDGPTLADLLRDNGQEPCDIGDSYRIARGLAEALRDVHRADVVHRDVKPANIIISDDRGVTLVDFGIALAEDDPRITRQGTTLGTPRYMSPEQWYGNEVTEASDVFGWGVVVGESLLGRHPIVGMDEDWRRALEECTADPGLTGAIGRLVGHALDPDPALRPSLADILRQLDLTEPIEASEATRTTIQLPQARLRDVRSAAQARHLLAPRMDGLLDEIATRPGIFAAAIAIAVILGWVIGYFAGVIAAAPWGEA